MIADPELPPLPHSEPPYGLEPEEEGMGYEGMPHPHSEEPHYDGPYEVSPGNGTGRCQTCAWC
jgi:hypothetical protein